MAGFDVIRIKYGYEGRSMSEYITVKEILFEEGDEVITLPSEFEGESVTHFGYAQGFTKAHEEWADWHHPGKGSDFVPDQYHFDYPEYRFPDSVKTVIIPASMIDISYTAVRALKTVSVEVAPDNPRYMAIDGVLCYKSTNRPVNCW